MMKRNSLAIAAAFAAALSLAACGNGDEEPADDTTPAEETTPAEDGAAMDAGAPAMDAGAPAMDAGAPAMDAGAPAMDAGAPAMDAGAPAMDAGAPAMDAGAPATEITLDDVVGAWAETAEACGVNEQILAPDAVAFGEETCIVTGAEMAEGGLAVELLCPVEGAEPATTTWTIAALGEAPYTEITITDADATTAFVACVAAE